VIVYPFCNQENELSFHAAIWLNAYADYTIFLFELEEYNDPNVTLEIKEWKISCNSILIIIISKGLSDARELRFLQRTRDWGNRPRSILIANLLLKMLCFTEYSYCLLQLEALTESKSLNITNWRWPKGEKFIHQELFEKNNNFIWLSNPYSWFLWF